MSKLTVLSLGWGVQSWTLAAMVALGDLPSIDAAIHADTTWERTATYAFAEQWTPWLEEHGVKVVTVTDRDSAKALTSPSNSNLFIPAMTARDVSSAVPGPHGDVIIPANTKDDLGKINGQLRRQCTDRWKIAPQQRWIRAELDRRGLKRPAGVVEKWLGISQDEWSRAKHSSLKYVTHRYPLLELKMTRASCIAYLQSHDLPVPVKSSCVFCPFHNRPAWQELKREDGPDWHIALAVDTAIRDKRPPYPLYVHPARIPLNEAVVIPEDFGQEQGSLFAPAEDDDLATCDSGHCFV